MFSSNQILDISTDFRDLPDVIKFAVKLYGDEIFTRHDGRVKMAFSEPVKGVYAIGLGSMEPYKTGPNKGWSHDTAKGWTDYPFDYDADIISAVVSQWAKKQPAPPHTGTDGTERLGVRVRCLTSMDDDLPPQHELPDWAWHNSILFFTPAHIAYDK